MSKKWRGGSTLPPNNAGYLAAHFGVYPGGACGDPAYIAGRIAHGTTIRAWDAIYCNHGRRMADSSMEPQARIRASAQFAKERMAAAKRELAKAIADNADAGIEARKRLARQTAAPASVGDATIDAEVRTYLRGLSSDERLKVSRVAAESGDQTILRAIATAPAMLSGLAPDVHRDRVNAYAALVAPDDHAAVRAHDEAVEALQRAQQEFDWHIGQLIDFEGAGMAGDGDKLKAPPVHPEFPQSIYSPDLENAA